MIPACEWPGCPNVASMVATVTAAGSGAPLTSQKLCLDHANEFGQPWIRANRPVTRRGQAWR